MIWMYFYTCIMNYIYDYKISYYIEVITNLIILFTWMDGKSKFLLL